LTAAPGHLEFFFKKGAQNACARITWFRFHVTFGVRPHKMRVAPQGSKVKQGKHKMKKKLRMERIATTCTAGKREWSWKE
jgi:hypothetical protein